MRNPNIYDPAAVVYEAYAKTMGLTTPWAELPTREMVAWCRAWRAGCEHARDQLGEMLMGSPPSEDEIEAWKRHRDQVYMITNHDPE